ncbi:MAG: hypothetical protein ACI4RI_04805 [Ruminococcus sp.]
MEKVIPKNFFEKNLKKVEKKGFVVALLLHFVCYNTFIIANLSDSAVTKFF